MVDETHGFTFFTNTVKRRPVWQRYHRRRPTWRHKVCAVARQWRHYDVKATRNSSNRFADWVVNGKTRA